jgi:hypothetical protein
MVLDGVIGATIEEASDGGPIVAEPGVGPDDDLVLLLGEGSVLHLREVGCTNVDDKTCQIDQGSTCLSKTSFLGHRFGRVFFFFFFFIGCFFFFSFFFF